MNTIQSINLIAVNPDIRKGRPYVVGTTVTVADVAIARIDHQQDADGIADWYGLSLAQVYAALSYYYEHKATIDADIQYHTQRAEALKASRVGNEGSLLSR
jgi:uncharacterized protein (DUF433 family)